MKKQLKLRKMIENPWNLQNDQNLLESFFFLSCLGFLFIIIIFSSLGFLLMPNKQSN